MVWSWLLHDVRPEELRLADHVYKWGSPLHTHHGLVYQILEAPTPLLDADADDLLDRIIVLHLSFCGEDMRAAKIHRVPLRTFLADETGCSASLLKRARYSVPRTEHMLKMPGTCYPFGADAPAVAMRRAQALLDLTELRPYDIGTLTCSNCEHVVVWCKTGRWRSAQVDGACGLAATAALLAGGVAALRSPGSSALLPLLGGVLLWNVAGGYGGDKDGDGNGAPPAWACGGRSVLAASVRSGDEPVSFSLAEGELVIGGAALADAAAEAAPSTADEADFTYVGSEDEAEYVVVTPQRGPHDAGLEHPEWPEAVASA